MSLFTSAIKNFRLVEILTLGPKMYLYNIWMVLLVFIIIKIYFRMQSSDWWWWITIQNRSVNSYAKMGGQVVMRREAALPGGAFYSAKTWVGNCRLCPPNIDTPAKQIGLVKPKIAFLLESRVEEMNQSTWIKFYCILFTYHRFWQEFESGGPTMLRNNL